MDRTTDDYPSRNDGLPVTSKDDVEPLFDRGLLSKSGSAISVHGLGETLLREEDGVDIVGSGGDVSAMKLHNMYDSALGSTGTNGAAAPRIEPVVRASHFYKIHI